MRRWALASVVLASFVLAPSASALRVRDGNGIRVLSADQLDSRLITVSVKTAALPGPAHVRVLLPSGYAAHPRRRYPVLYLLHGTSGDASDWTVKGDAERTTAALPLIVVMPDMPSTTTAVAGVPTGPTGSTSGRRSTSTNCFSGSIGTCARSPLAAAARSPDSRRVVSAR